MTASPHALLANPISERLAQGWYPSSPTDRDSVSGYAHDRHVLIWVRASTRRPSQNGSSPWLNH